jgi:hypothetical protein
MTNDTLPNVRTTATWQVQYTVGNMPEVNVFGTYQEAKSSAAKLEALGMYCVHVVGPIMHEVPAT